MQGFREHIKGDHNMWNYVYYSMHLDSIDTSNHTAIQKHVYGLVSYACWAFILMQLIMT